MDINQPYQGGSTPWKEEGIGCCAGMSLCRSMGRPHEKFWLLDCNAGDGMNLSCEGSALVLARQALKLGRQHIRACFCDNNPVLIDQLKGNLQRLQPWPETWDVTPYCCDNADFLALIAAGIRQEERNPSHAFGLNLVDPVSYTNGFPHAALNAFHAEFPEMDSLIHFNVSVWRRRKGSHEAGQKGHFPWPSINHIAAGLHKNFAWIRKISRGGGGTERFTTLYSHNWDRGSRKPFKDFVPLDSPQGQEIAETFRRIDPSQGFLF